LGLGRGPRPWAARARGFAPRRLALLGATLGALVALPATSLALDAAEARARAQRSLAEVSAGEGELRPVSAFLVQRNPAKLLAEAVLHLRTGQRAAAIEKLNLVVELGAQGRAPAATSEEAEFLLGEAYFADDQLYSARRWLERVTDRASAGSEASAGRAASRLVDIALRTDRRETLGDVLVRIERLLAAGGGSTAALQYAKAKALFGLGRYADARAAADVLRGGDLLELRAAYLQGTAAMKETQAATPAGAVPDFSVAVEAFERAATLPQKAEDADAASIQALAWLAIGRLHYEEGRLLRAAAAYQKVPRKSEHFARALFELAWTYVRMGDYDRSLRALELLTVLEPGLVDGADASLLRADLLLRAGRFREAETAYDAARAKYEPLRRQVEDFLAANTEPAAYYDNLTASEIESSGQVSALVVDWAREEAREERIFAIVDEVNHARELVRRTRRLASVLRVVLASSSRAKLYPELRLALAAGMDDEAGTGSSELEGVRRERRALMARVAKLPTSPGDFTVREAEAEKAWNGISQAVQRQQLQADHLQALVNGLRRVLDEPQRFGIHSTESAVERYRAELAESEKELGVYRQEIARLQGQVELGRAQVGFGDQRFEQDEVARARFAELLSREVALAAAGQDKARGAASYARSVSPLLTRIGEVETRLLARRAGIEQEAARAGAETLATVEQEARAVEEYAAQLDGLDEGARVLVGEVARDNFARVRDRLKSVVLRADVGLVQKAWEVRELRRFRVRELQRERAREERLINDELREVLDDAGEDQ
jgi:hypothetical protein